MNFFHFIKQESEALDTSLLLYYSLAGLLNFLIIAIIIYSLGTIETHTSYLTIFLLCISILGFIFIQKYSLDQTCRIVEKIVTKIRIRLTDRIRRIDLLSFESMRQEDFFMLLNRDTTDISGAAKNISRIISSLALTIVACFYITLISPLALILTGLVIFYGVRLYQKQISEYEKEYSQASQKENRFFESMKHLLLGFKELKLNDHKNNDLYHNTMIPLSGEAKDHNISATNQLNNSVILAQVFSYLLLGILIFIYPKITSIDQFTLIQVVGLILFVTTGPVREIVGSLPLIERANSAISNIREMENKLDQLDYHSLPTLEETRKTTPFSTLELKEVVFTYNHTKKGQPFQIGPIDLKIQRGEIVFFMGGNGSGKTTLLKVLIGLYFPDTGKMKLNGRFVTRQNISRYRSYFSVIFQNVHLFNYLLGIQSFNREWCDTMLERLKIAEKTDIREDKSITSLKLSMGQKKRLALLISDLENRDIHVYDEWAADQDPLFRRYFYEVYLRELIQRGKTVIAITHDDAYYHIADRIYKMDYGKLFQIK